MDKNIKRDAPRWNSGNAEQPSQAEGRSSRDVRPLPVKPSRSRNLSGLSGYEETNAARALDGEQSEGVQGRPLPNAPATGGPRRRALSAAPSGNHRTLEAKKGPVDRFAEEQIARLNAELDAAGAGVAAAIHGAPRLVTRASRAELLSARARELPPKPFIHTTPNSYEGGAQKDPAHFPSARLDVAPDAHRFHDSAMVPLATLRDEPALPQDAGMSDRTFAGIDGSRFGSRDVLEAAARQVSAIVDDLDAQLRKTRLAASKALPQRKAARSAVAQSEQARADARRQLRPGLDTHTAFDEARPGPMDAYETRIVGLREAWELAQHATRAVKRALNAAPSAHGPQTGTPEVQRFAEELAGQANHALTQLYQALEAVPAMPSDGAVS